MPTLAALAEELAVDPDDVAVLATRLMRRRPHEQLPEHVAAALRQQLDPNGERTRFSAYWPDANDEQ
jgi:hypothetical protein